MRRAGVRAALRYMGMAWRVGATGLCFAGFGLGGLLVRALLPPLLAVLGRRPERRARLAKQIIRLAFRALITVMRGVRVLTYDVTGLEKLQRHGLLILANHPSLIDIVFLIALVPRADCVVKSSLRRNPFTGTAVRAANYVFNDSGEAVVAGCIDAVRCRHNLIIFPEGTRTSHSGVVTLQRGAAHIAIRGTFNITPVIIRCSPPVLTKGTPWYRVPRQRPHFKIEVRDDIAVLPFIENMPSEAIAARRLTDYLTHYFDPRSNEDERHADAGKRDQSPHYHSSVP